MRFLGKSKFGFSSEKDLLAFGNVAGNQTRKTQKITFVLTFKMENIELYIVCGKNFYSLLTQPIN